MQKPPFKPGPDETIIDSPTVIDPRSAESPFPGTKPQPGGRPPEAPATVPPGGFPDAGSQKTEIFEAPGGESGHPPDTLPPNPQRGDGEARGRMVAAATRLLNLMVSLKNTERHPEPERLRLRVLAEVRKFRATLDAQGVPDTQIERGSYVLCTALDDIVFNNTTWGNHSTWKQQSLSAEMHRNMEGGRVVFEQLDQLIRQPATHRELLELIYICLSLGFKGIYRQRPDVLEPRRDALYATLAELERDRRNQELSPNWRGEERRARPPGYYLPLWLGLSLFVALLAGLYSWLLFDLAERSQPAWAALKSIQLPAVAATPVPIEEEPRISAGPDLVARLKTFFNARDNLETRGEVEVEWLTSDRRAALIRVPRGNIFRSGSATLNEALQALMTTIAGALQQESGPIKVVGHTDNVPIRRTTRFPSNLALSQARAETVREVLIDAGVDPARIGEPEGRADSEPLPGLDPNSRAGRARNRRVEIVILDQNRQAP